MKKCPHWLLTLLLIAFTTNSFAQTEAKTLLWRISGKGMPKPSYLYGTMHVRTKKLFDFPDSLYKAIDNVDVFALEVNMDSLSAELSAYWSQNSDEETGKERRRKEKKLKDIFTKEERKELRALIAENAGVDPDELTTKQIYLWKEKLTKLKTAPDDMPVFIDAFLYDIAKDKGKTIAGLEKLQDQIKLLEGHSFGDINARKLLDMLKKGGDLEEQLAANYANKDLQKLYEISELYSEDAERAILSDRNVVMLRRMDSIMQRHSLFAAVGALHLPGNKGLISLLKANGYTVMPVVCTATTNGAEYHFVKTSTQWVTMKSDEDYYSVDMPGPAADVTMFDGEVKMKSFFDLKGSRCFLSSRLEKSGGPEVSTEYMIRRLQKTILKEAKETEIKDITNSGMSGKEYFYTDKDGTHYHLQLFGNTTDVYLLMAYSNTWSIRRVDSFFKSFRLLSPPPPLQAVTTASAAATSPAATATAAASISLGQPKVLWENNYDLNFSIPQKPGFSSDSKYFAMGFSLGNITIFDAATGNIIVNYREHSGHVYCTVFQPGGPLLASGDKDGYVVLYDYKAQKAVKTIAAHKQVIMAMAFSSDGKLLITGGRDNSIKIWEAETGKLLSSIDDVTGNIKCLHFSTDGKSIIAGTTALMKGLRLFNASNGREEKVYESANLQSMDVSADGMYAATANLEKKVLLFDLRRQSPKAQLSGHDRNLRDVAFSPDGRVLYSGSVDRDVKAWDIARLQQLGTIFHAEKPIMSITCSPDGRYLAVTDENKTLTILEIKRNDQGK